MPPRDDRSSSSPNGAAASRSSAEYVAEPLSDSHEESKQQELMEFAQFGAMLARCIIATCPVGEWNGQCGSRRCQIPNSGAACNSTHRALPI